MMHMNTNMHSHAEHFDSLERQEHASRLGMWIFLASEALLFAGLFTLYAAYRAHDPMGFHVEEEHHATKILGSINTGVLLISSTCVAFSVHALRENRRRRVVLLPILATILLGLVFLAIKF